MVLVVAEGVKSFVSKDARLEVVRPRQMTYGSRYDAVVLLVPVNEDAAVQDWYERCVLTRLKPGGWIMGVEHGARRLP